MAGLSRVPVAQCYEPERDSPEKIKELKSNGGEICPVECYDEVADPKRIVTTRKERGATACRYEHASSKMPGAAGLTSLS